MNYYLLIIMLLASTSASVLIYSLIKIFLRGASWHEKKLRTETYGELENMFLFVDFKKLKYTIFLSFLLLPLIIWFLTENPLFTALSLIIPIILPGRIVKARKTMRFNKFISQFPDALMIMSSSLRAGASLNIAIDNLVKESKAPMNQEFALFIRSQRMGASFDAALKEMETRLPIQEFMLFSAGLRISRDVGGNLADILESLAQTLYKKLQTEGKIKSLTAQGKIQGFVMSGLPLILMLALTFLEPAAMKPLFHSLVGWAVLTLIMIMEILGYYGVKKITTIDV